NVSDERNISALDTTTVTINEPDQTAPTIEFESPINAIYIRNRAVFPFFRPLIFGSIELNVSAEDEESTVESISIYINSKLVKSITDDSGNYTWDEIVFGRRTITVKAVNSEGIEGIEEKIVWKFF
ncbi:MAG TPA: Ig-like domain-containing protein, partial [Candidatus Thermoplasmatota archaeon]|nr:Ig-like domain-containing protein [Candidatus Thermoplasmatota archaeon]